MSHCFDSACHCGALRLAFMTDVAPSQWRVRACQCAFCRAHGARTTSDSAGSVRFTILDSAALVEYRFGLRTAEFLLCARCGVYIAAMVTTPRGRFATINVNALRDVAHIEPGHRRPPLRPCKLRPFVLGHAPYAQAQVRRVRRSPRPPPSERTADEPLLLVHFPRCLHVTRRVAIVAAGGTHDVFAALDFIDGMGLRRCGDGGCGCQRRKRAGNELQRSDSMSHGNSPPYFS